MILSVSVNRLKQTFAMRRWISQEVPDTCFLSPGGVYFLLHDAAAYDTIYAYDNKCIKVTPDLCGVALRRFPCIAITA